MRILALILARGGSKRLPRKNLRMLGARPLLLWSIEPVKGMESICDILVSTDDEEIATMAASAEALVPWLRPAELAADSSPSIDACLHALDWYENARGAVDGVLLLQPTSPFRRVESIRRGIALFGESKRPVVGVSPAASHPLWCFRIADGRLRPYVEQGGLGVRSQDLPPAYVVNGALYVADPPTLRVERSFFVEDTLPLLMSAPQEAVDIDSEWDWTVAETFCRSRELLP